MKWLGFVAFFWVTCGVASVPAVASDEDKTLRERRFVVGLGAAIVDFDTNFKFTDKVRGGALFVDAEGTLGLPAIDNVPMLFGRYRFSSKHSIEFSVFRIKREATLLSGSLSLFDFRLSGRATLSDDTSFYYANYSCTLFQDERSRVSGAVGLYGLDLDYRQDLFGEIDFQGEPLGSDTYSAHASVLAPLPMFGLDVAFALTNKWGFATQIAFVPGSFRTVPATVFDVAVRSSYAFSEHVSLVLGIEYLDADVTIDEGDLTTDTSYGFDGGVIGFDIGF